MKPSEQETILKIMLQFSNSNSAMETRDHSKNGASLKSQMSKRNKYSLVIFVSLFFFAAFSTYAQETKLRIAVIDLYDNAQNTIINAKEITSNLTTELVNTRKFRVLERSRIEEVIREQGFQSTQMASARAVELGKLLGVHKIITGECSLETTSIRLIDIESGDIEAAITISNRRPKTDKKKFNPYWFSSEEIAKKILIELFK